MPEDRIRQTITNLKVSLHQGQGQVTLPSAWLCHLHHYSVQLLSHTEKFHYIFNVLLKIFVFMSVITGDRRFSSEENKERQGICGLPNGDDPISSELLQGQNRI